MKCKTQRKKGRKRCGKVSHFELLDQRGGSYLFLNLFFSTLIATSPKRATGEQTFPRAVGLPRPRSPARFLLPRWSPPLAALGLVLTLLQLP